MPKMYFTDPGTISTLEAHKKDLTFWVDYEPQKIIEAARDSECLLCPAPYPWITEDIIKALPKLKLIQSAGAGYNKIDIEAAARAGIPVANAPGLNSRAVAELVLAAVINLQRGLVRADKSIKEGCYQAVREELLAHGMSELDGTKWGIIGLGEIGSKVARLGRMFEVQVYYYSRTRKEKLEKELDLRYIEMKELLANSDVVIICLALAKETDHLIGLQELQTMKKGSIIVNVGRGGVIDEEALADALIAGKPSGAALDTFNIEPLPGDHPLLTLPENVQERIFLTPHLGGVTTQALNRMLSFALDNCTRVLKGEQPLAIVNGVE